MPEDGSEEDLYRGEHKASEKLSYQVPSGKGLPVPKWVVILIWEAATSQYCGYLPNKLNIYKSGKGGAGTDSEANIDAIYSN